MVKKILLRNNIRSLKAQAKILPLEELEAILLKLTMIVDERRDLHQKAQENLANYNRKVDAYLAQIKNEGITLTELLKKGDFPIFKKIRKSRPPRPPKYKYHDNDGNLRTWTGQGRMPKPIQQSINLKAKSLHDFLI